ncbi:hypothetical protein ABBQ38_011738 [Trebouxia sp. C0009 RCD-2024]
MVSAVLQGAGIVLAALGGVALGVQAGTNSTLGKFVGKGIAGIISFASGLLCIAIYFVVSTYGANAQGPSVAGFKETPWWGYVGGVLGSFSVIIVIIFAQQLGSGTVSGVAVTAQLITAVVLDAFGIVGFVRRQIVWPRVVGAVLMLIGVVLVSVFRGEPLVQPPVNLANSPAS